MWQVSHERLQIGDIELRAGWKKREEKQELLTWLKINYQSKFLNAANLES